MPEKTRLERERDRDRAADVTGRNPSETPDANADPITGAPGAHPVGTGMGAAGGGAAGAAIGAAMGGPIGAAVGLAVGAFAGGLGGKAAAEAVNPTAEDAYWREHYRNEPYVDPARNYDDYAGAYRTGYEGYAESAGAAGSFEEAEPDLRKRYETSGQSSLGWDQAKPAVRAAWERVSGNLERLIGYGAVDRDGARLGSVHNLWADHSGQPAYLGIRTEAGDLNNYVIPAHEAEVSHGTRRIRVPFTQEKLKGAPYYAGDVTFTQEMEDEVRRYYELDDEAGSYEMDDKAGSTSTAMNREGARTEEETTMRLKEETLNVGKKEVTGGGVRLRKVVRSETVNQPVELEREELVVERVPGSGQAAGDATFSEEEIYVPLRREEAVVNKESKVREEVRVGKKKESERRNISGTVRREDVEINENEAGREGSGRR